MKRINLIPAVRNALADRGISTVLVVNAVNSALGELEATETKEKLGAGRVTKSLYKVSSTVSTKYEGGRSTVLDFDAWHSALEKADKIATFDNVTLPTAFDTWLAKMAEATKKVAEYQPANS